MTDVMDETHEQTEPDEDADVLGAPDEPEEEQEQAAPDEPEDEPTGSKSDKEIEQAIEKLDKEAKRHTSRVSEIMGDDALGLVPCELCEPNIPGFRWADVPDDDPRHVLVTFLREGGEVTPPDDDEAQRCDRCDGYGVTLTHSRVPGSDTRPCTKCAAKGWTSADERRDWESRVQSQKVAQEINTYSTAVVSVTDNVPTVDAWGRPKGAPFFGMNPDYMDVNQKAQDYTRVQV